MRTISLLPGVRSIARHGENLDGNGKGAIQQIYNNLALQVDVSEVYILPASFNPRKLDPVTGRLEEPVIMFDELVIQAGKFSEAINPFEDANASENQSTPELEEVESHEYSELVTHIDWFAKRNSTATPTFLKTLPTYSGDAVITCDNTDYVNTLLDKDREGLIFSVPFYDVNANFAGVVSAIIRVNALQSLLPQGDFALTSPNRKFRSKLFDEANADTVRWKPSLFGNGSNNDFVNQQLIQTSDTRGPWTMESKFNTDAFYAGQEIGLIRRFAAITSVTVLLLSIVGLFWVKASRRHAAIAQHRATHDALTGLPNRRQLERDMAQAFEKAKRGKMSFVFYLDLDRFKIINDTLGHQAGDEVIKTVADRISSVVRAMDTVARIGGDEFVVLLPDALEGIGFASQVADRIATAVSSPMILSGQTLDVGISIGIATIDSLSVSCEEVIRHADLALFRAKNAGRGTVRFYAADMDNERERRQVLIGELKQAVTLRQFELHYQTIVDATTSKVFGCEALLRWRHPKLGLIPPMDFIPLAEEFGLIEKIGEWVLNQACEDAVKLPHHYRMAVNVSPVQLRNPTFPLLVLAILNRTGLNASRLELEFTETVLLEASDDTLKMISQLRGIGVQIALDDFGIGYSSIGYLKDFEFDRIKIDRSFVKNVENPKDVAIFKAITDMSTTLGLAVTAEGIETKAQLDVVRAQGCKDVQGYFFSVPKPFAELLADATAGKSITA